ncbi:MAG: hypothetical protein M3450_15855, partial [Actinomycetota bacterium]|nr:hypothetical protein [Actinomycetota bacterium]
VGPGAEGSGNTPEAAGSLVSPGVMVSPGVPEGVAGVLEAPGVLETPPVSTAAEPLAVGGVDPVGEVGGWAESQDVTMSAAAMARLRARRRNGTVRGSSRGPVGQGRIGLAR